MQAIFYNGMNGVKPDAVCEEITITCNDNGVERIYTFNNITPTNALHSICAVYALKDVKKIKYKNCQHK